MQKLIETLKEFGIEVPADKLSEVKKAISEHYKNVAEHNKALSKLEGERDSWKEKAETAEETLKKFEGIEPENIKRELEDWKKKAEEAEENAKQQIYERDFSDALKTEMESYKFTSEAAKKAIMAEINEAGLKLKDGRILGLTDLMEQIKEKDGSAFADKSKPDILHHGIIAQDAEENFAKGWTPVRQAGQYKAVAYEEIIGDLIGAVKYLHGRVQELERKLGTEED